MSNIKTFYDKTNLDMDAKIAEQTTTGKVLVEVQNHIDGDFLVFADAPLTPAVSTEERLKTIEARLTALEKKP